MKPCASCPWRVSTRTEDIPGKALNHARFRRTMADLEVVDGQLVKPVAMACHLGVDERPVPCAGFMLQVGVEAPVVRLLASLGMVKLKGWETDAPLHPDVEAVLAVHPDRP